MGIKFNPLGVGSFSATSDSGGGSGAATDLSNLDAVTNINSDLIPSGDGVLDLGSLANPWDDVYAYNFRCPFSTQIISDNGSISIFTIQENPGNSINIYTEERTGANVGAPVNIYTGQTNSGISGALNFSTGNSSNGNSGNITLTIGTAVSGTRGSIKFVDGSEGTPGHVWTQTAADGSGEWQAISAGANTALSNLTTTAINQDLIHGTAATNWTIRTANNGAGASGDMIVRTGTATTTRGQVRLQADTITFGDVGIVTILPANGGNLGSSSAPFLLNTSTIDGHYLGANRYELAAGPKSTPASGSVNGSIEAKDNTGFTLYSTSQVGNTGPLSLETGNSSSFASGNIKIQSGTANTTSGNITLQTGTGATRGTINLNARYADFTNAPIGSNLVPEANGTRNLGTAGGVAGWQSLNLARSAAGVVTQYWQGNLKGTMETGPTLPSGTPVALGLAASTNGSLGLYSIDNGSGQTQNVLVETGNATGGNSGGIYLTTGTATGTRGPIEMNASVIRHNKVTSTGVVWESGNTASRPGTPVLGQRYFDTDLAAGNGKPIWYNGTNWVDATGTVV